MNRIVRWDGVMPSRIDITILFVMVKTVGRKRRVTVMAEYIEREDILQRWNNALKEMIPEADGKHAISFETVIRFIENYPAADVVEVVHGHWVGLEYDGYADGLPVYDLWECSECGNEVRGEDVPDTHPWCNGCGARMDGADVQNT